MVAATSRAQANGKTPIHSIFNMYFSGLEAFGQAYDPFTKGFARAQLECMGHLNRRAQAYLEIPNRLAQCRTPQDFVNEQVRFWRTAYEDYTASMGRVTEALSSFALPHLALWRRHDERTRLHLILGARGAAQLAQPRPQGRLSRRGAAAITIEEFHLRVRFARRLCAS